MAAPVAVLPIRISAIISQRDLSIVAGLEKQIYQLTAIRNQMSSDILRRMASGATAEAGRRTPHAIDDYKDGHMRRVLVIE